MRPLTGRQTGDDVDDGGTMREGHGSVAGREAARMTDGHGHGVLDMSADAELEAMVRVAAAVTGVPTATLGLMDSDRQCQLITVGFEQRVLHELLEQLQDHCSGPSAGRSGGPPNVITGRSGRPTQSRHGPRGFPPTIRA